eukprot:SAG31_NODE_1577_length_7836_cov_3.212744_11_plen_76_part_00
MICDAAVCCSQLLYLMIGAVNYPDVMLPAYIEDGPIALVYFGSFAILFIFGVDEDARTVDPLICWEMITHRKYQP